MKIFATSDQHFTHKNIIKYAKRPFSLNEDGIKECIETIINKHNEIVSDNDLVFYVGDLDCGKYQSKELLTELFNNMNGHKIFIRGNHDRYETEFYETLFSKVYEDYVVHGETMICHYPLYKSQWCSDLENQYIKEIPKNVSTIIHGHCHNNDPKDWDPDGFKRVNVCVDFQPNDFYPVDITHLIKT